MLDDDYFENINKLLARENPKQKHLLPTDINTNAVEVSLEVYNHTKNGYFVIVNQICMIHKIIRVISRTYFNATNNIVP